MFIGFMVKCPKFYFPFLKISIKVKSMSKKRIINALKTIGLSTIDTQVYVFLAKQGPHKMSDMASVLNLEKRKIHKSLKELQSINIVKASIEDPPEFVAVSFEEVINLVIEIKKEQAKTLQASKEELLSSWRSITEKDTEKS
jgi:sugar-specific transcriptional regulator TrmB